MLRRLVRWLVGLPKRRSDDESDGGHAGSLLDASVNFAHGQKDGRDAIRAMQDIDEQASKLEDVDDRHR